MQEQVMAAICSSEAYMLDQLDQFGIDWGRDDSGDSTTWWWAFNQKGLAAFGTRAWQFADIHAGFTCFRDMLQSATGWEVE